MSDTPAPKDPSDPGDPRDDEMELINSEFESMVAGLSLDESTPNTYLDALDLDALEQESSLDQNHFEQPNPTWPGLRSFFQSARIAIRRWLRHENNRDDGVEL